MEREKGFEALDVNLGNVISVQFRNGVTGCHLFQPRDD